MAVQIGPRIGIEGEKEYRQALQQIAEQMKTLDSAMDNTTSTWNQNTSALTKNRAAAQNLNQQIELQKERITIINSLLEASAEKFGENATQTQRWQRALNDASTSLNYMEQRMEGLGNAQNFSDLTTKLADAGTKMQNLGQSLSAVGQKMTMSVTLPIVAAGTAAVNLASQLAESSSKVDVVFGSMSESVKQFADTTLEAYGVSKVQAMDLLGTYGAMATAMGVSDQAAASMATTLTGLAGDLAAFNNKSVDVAANSLKGIFTGEAEALKNFNVVMTQNTLEDFAAKQGKVYNQMTQAEKVMTRYQYVMEATADAQGNFALTGDETAGSIQKFKGSLQDLGAALGEHILPIITPIIQALTSFVQTISQLPEPVQKAVVVTLLLAAAFGPLVIGIGAVVSALGTLAPALPVIAAGLLAIAAGIAIGSALWAAWEKLTDGATSLSEGISTAYNKIMSKNDELKSSVHGFVSDVIDYFRELPSKIVQALKDAADKVKQQFDSMISKAKQSGKDFINGFVEGIKNTINKVIDAVKNVAQTVQDFLGFSCPDKGPLHEYETWMPDFMQGLAKGIRSNMGVVKSAMNGVAKEMAIPLSSSAQMNMALAGAGSSGSMAMPYGGTTMNVYVDHISELSDLVRIQNQAQQRYRMGAR